VGRLVAHQLHISSGRVASDLAVGSDAESNVLPVKVTDPSPTMAAAIANAYVNQYIAFRKAAAISQIDTAESLIGSKLNAIPTSQQQGSVYNALVADRNELDLLKSAQTGDAQVVQTANTPGSPSYPTPSRDGALGLILGLLVGTGLVSLLERRDQRIKSTDELEALYGVPLLGTVPESSHLRRGRVARPREEEAFLMMRAQLRYFDVDHEVTRLLVTSADTGEGKSLISFNLARAAARTDGRRALLIEADLRRPSLSGLIGGEGVAGLAELLSHSQDMASGLRELVVTPDAPDSDDRPVRLDILLAGSIPPNPLELLESERMSELLEHASSIYDLVVIDTPPIGLISDAIPLVHQVDGLIVVSRLRVSRRDHVLRLMKRINGLNAHVFGVVANSARSDVYGDYGGYYASPTTGSPTTGDDAGRRGRRDKARARPS
jgi:polysaccharide biosynthesis transport protein